MAFRTQQFIHQLEEGAGYRYLKGALGVIAMLTLAVWYDTAAFRNLATQEGMDAAQLARNIASGNGYTTLFVRPFSMHLVFQTATNKLADLVQAQPSQPEPKPTPEQERLIRLIHLREPHPDLAHAPLYPLLLAGILKVMPFDYAVSKGTFRVYKPDLWIALFNQALFLAAAGLMFGLARKLFDEPVAWVSAAVLVGADVFWRFSLAGLSTLLLVVILFGIVWVLAKMDQLARAEATAPGTPPNDLGSVQTAETGVGTGAKGQILWVGLALAAGILVGLAGLTRYSFGWLIVPVAVFLATLPGAKRGALAVWAAAAFLVMMAPWVARNFQVSGTPFGTAGYAVFQNTAVFTEDHLERSLNPNFSGWSTSEVFRKALVSGRDIIQNDLPKCGGSWVSAFFLVGLLVPFRNPTLGRLRWFVVGCLGLFVCVQAVGRTGITADGPEVNSENLLVVFAPFVFMYGVGLFFVLLDQLVAPPPLRYSMIGFFCLIGCASLVFTLLPPPTSTLAYPPYHPPWIQDKAQWLEPDELMMADIPWAVAWYGQRQCVGLPLKYRNEPSDKWKNNFYEINDYIKPVKALYLSAKTMKTVETRAIADWGHFAELPPEPGKNDTAGPLFRWAAGENSVDWASFVLETLLKGQVPTGFPLKAAPRGLVPELFLTDSERVRAKTIQSP